MADLRRLGLSVLGVLAVFAGACAGEQPTSVEPAVATADPVDQVSAVAATEVPIPTAAAVSDADRVAAAVGLLEESDDVRITEFDVLSSSVSTSGVVELQLCAWSRESVFDEVLVGLVDVDSALEADLVSLSLGEGECLNETLISSVYELINEYDAALAVALSAPSVGAAQALVMTDGHYNELEERVAELAVDGVVFSGLEAPTRAPNGAVVPILIRRTSAEGVGTLEVAICREMNQLHGLYRSGALVDDEKPADPGDHLLRSYIVVSGGTRLEVEGWTGRVWAHCLRPSNWAEAMEGFAPGSVPWRPVEGIS